MKGLPQAISVTSLAAILNNNMPLQYLIVFAQIHHEFRIPELRSVAELHGISLSTLEDQDPCRPYMVVDLDREEHAQTLARRCILIK